VAIGDGSWSAINQEDNDIIYNSTQNLNMQRSTNNGLSYYNIAPPSSGNTNFIAPYVLSPVDNQTMYAGRSVVYKSTNGGSGWTATNASSQFQNNPALTMGISSTNTQVAYVATMPIYDRARIFKTFSGGDEWIDITGDLPDLMITDIHVDVNDHTVVFVTLGGFGASHLFKTDDAGYSWLDIGNALPDIPGWAVTTDPLYPQIIYYGNEFGVYISFDDGINWMALNEGFGDGVFAMDLKISESDRKLKIATHGNGTYERELATLPTSMEDIVFSGQQDLGLRNYPNPFSVQTSIQFSLNRQCDVNMTIFDLSGRVVEQIAQGLFDTGSHQIRWNPSVPPDGLQSGTYICRLIAGNQSATIKIQHCN